MSESDPLSALCRCPYRARVKELENRSKGLVGIFEHSHWHTDTTLRSSPSSPDSGAENGFIFSRARPRNGAPRFIWGMSFWECSPAMNVRWAPFERCYLAKCQGYLDVMNESQYIIALRVTCQCVLTRNVLCSLASQRTVVSIQCTNCGCGGCSEVGEALCCLW